MPNALQTFGGSCKVMAGHFYAHPTTGPKRATATGFSSVPGVRIFPLVPGGGIAILEGLSDFTPLAAIGAATATGSCVAEAAPWHSMRIWLVAGITHAVCAHAFSIPRLPAGELAFVKPFHGRLDRARLMARGGPWPSQVWQCH